MEREYREVKIKQTKIYTTLHVSVDRCKDKRMRVMQRHPVPVRMHMLLLSAKEPQLFTVVEKINIYGSEEHHTQRDKGRERNRYNFFTIFIICSLSVCCTHVSRISAVCSCAEKDGFCAAAG